MLNLETCTTLKAEYNKKGISNASSEAAYHTIAFFTRTLKILSLYTIGICIMAIGQVIM